MRIAVAGGGPAGLYLAALLKRSDPRHEIRVIERNPPDATFGWGVVFSEETLGEFREADPRSFERITEAFARWDAIDVRYGGETIRSRGHSFSAIARVRLLAILQERCRELGVSMEFERELSDDDLRELAGSHDLLVGSDGVNSTVRRMYEKELGSSIDARGTRFVWFGTDTAFPAFTFVFRQTEHGLFQVHAYPFDARSSTFIVECGEATWRRAGLDQASEEESIAFCEELFGEELAGHRLLSNRSLWFSFATVRSQTWHAGNVVVMGDAAHTAHFTIGSGTKLAMEDAISLAGALERHAGGQGPPSPAALERALTHFELERQPAVERFQEAARESQTYFEDVSRYAAFEPIQFAFNLLTRSGRIGHTNLSQRDPAFVRRVDSWFHARASGDGGSPVQTTGGRLVSPPPAFAAYRLGGIVLPNRMAAIPGPAEDVAAGSPGDELAGAISSAAASGVGLVFSPGLAVTWEGRVSPSSAGLFTEEDGEAWAGILAEAREAGPGDAQVRLAARLGHAGRRGSTRPRSEGTDRPLRYGNWPVLGPSPIPFAPWSRVPREMDLADLARVRDAFAAAAERAAEVGFDVLEIDMARGYLLATFLSPLSNHRSDAYGGSPDGRRRYPLEVVDAVRGAWPGDRPLAVRLTADDRARGGLTVGEAVATARELAGHGVDLVHVAGGGTVPETRPEYRRFHLVPAADRIRNEAGVPTLVEGRLTTLDEVNTVLAAGRADLCLVELEP
jgi:anthraniloyl-CoA monooxygenase